MSDLSKCLLFHFFATSALVGLIWTVQLAIYPRFADGKSEGSTHFRYCRGIGIVVAPLIFLEGATGLLWCFLAPLNPVAHAGLFLIGVNLFSTAFLQAPLHVRLMRGWDDRAARHLVATNWIRTIVWTVRAGLVGFALAKLPS